MLRTIRPRTKPLPDSNEPNRLAASGNALGSQPPSAHPFYDFHNVKNHAQANVTAGPAPSYRLSRKVPATVAAKGLRIWPNTQGLSTPFCIRRQQPQAIRPKPHSEPTTSRSNATPQPDHPNPEPCRVPPPAAPPPCENGF